MNFPGTHPSPLVLLSVVIAVAASYTAIDLANRVRSATGPSRLGWIVLSALAMGGGVWAMHFIAMLAFGHQNGESGYALGETVLSLVLPVAVTALCLAAAARFGGSRGILAVCGVGIGLAIVAMHFLGMHAVRGVAVVTDTPTIVFSLVIAVVASTIATFLAAADETVGQRIAAAVVMAGAVAGVHFVAMSGTRFVPDQGAPSAPTDFDQTTVAMLVAAAAVLVLALALIASYVDRRMARLVAREAAALKESELRFRMLVEGVVDYAIFMLDPHGYITNWNSGAQRSKGYAAQEIVGRHFSTFYTEEDRRAGLPARALAMAENEGKFESEGWRVRKGGSRYWAHVVIDPIRDENGRLVAFAKITRDVTERRESQRKLDETRMQLIHSQKLETIGQLTGGIAHDFNNLLAVVIGNLELLKKRLPEDPKLSRLVETALKGAQRGASLTSRMLSFARKQDLKPTAVDVPTLVAGMADLLQRSLGPKVRIEMRFPLRVRRAHVDENQLELALVNLAVNARDAMPDGGTLTISAREATLGAAEAEPAGLAPGLYIVIAVADTGTGMDEATVAKAIEPFFTTKGVGKGTGLGLSMVHGLAAQSGGRLALKSSLGAGTTVEIWLPVDASGYGAEEPVRAANDASEPKRALDILVVDDDALVAMATSALIEDLGHHVIETHSANEALAMLRSGRQVDLVLTDEAMPGMTGSQLARQLGLEWPDLPVVIGTGYADPPDDLDDRLPRISKPFDQALLARMLETQTQRGQPLRETTKFPQAAVAARG